MKKLIKENIEKLEDNLLNPPAEVREDMQEVRLETLEVLKKNKEYSQSVIADDEEAKSKLEQVYQLVLDTRYKVSQDNFYSP